MSPPPTLFKYFDTNELVALKRKLKKLCVLPLFNLFELNWLSPSVYVCPPTLFEARGEFENSLKYLRDVNRRSANAIC
jgi:hypothetical protein